MEPDAAGVGPGADSLSDDKVGQNTDPLPSFDYYNQNLDMSTAFINPFGHSQTLNVFHLNNYTFGTKEIQMEEDTSVAARLRRLQDEYEREGWFSFMDPFGILS